MIPILHITSKPSIKLLCNTPTIKAIEISGSNGTGLEKHSTPKEAFFYVATGTVAFYFDENPVVLNAGTGVVIDPAKEHALIGQSDFVSTLTTIK